MCTNSPSTTLQGDGPEEEEKVEGEEEEGGEDSGDEEEVRSRVKLDLNT